METVQTWGEAILTSLQNLWLKIIAFIPELLSALIVLIVGLLLAGLLSKLVFELLKLTKIDLLIDKTGITKWFKTYGIKFSLSGLLAGVVKWFIIIAVLIVVADILNIPQITDFLERIVLYIPNVLVAIVILAIGLILGKAAYTLTNSSLKAAKLEQHQAHTVAALAKWALIIFALLAALTQLNIASELIQILFTGIVVMFALAGGLAFGLGGKDKAAEWLDSMHKMKK
jgi:hypothetical protein